MRRARRRRNPDRSYEDAVWKVAFDALGANRSERQRVRSWIDLSYPVTAGIVGAIIAGAVVVPVLGGTGAVVAGIFVGSWAAAAVAERVAGHRK